MTFVLSLLLALGWGGGLALLYFGGLWLTVQRAVEADHPHWLLLGSFAARSALVLLGFFLVIAIPGADWTLLLASLLGFLAGRTVLVHRWRPHAAPSPAS
jgi:F1F0 ATPase subunit 2